jgi:hypothetical protein
MGTTAGAMAQFSNGGEVPWRGMPVIQAAQLVGLGVAPAPKTAAVRPDG